MSRRNRLPLRCGFRHCFDQSRLQRVKQIGSNAAIKFITFVRTHPIAFVTIGILVYIWYPRIPLVKYLYRSCFNVEFLYGRDAKCWANHTQVESELLFAIAGAVLNSIFVVGAGIILSRFRSLWALGRGSLRLIGQALFIFFALTWLMAAVYSPMMKSSEHFELRPSGEFDGVRFEIAYSILHELGQVEGLLDSLAERQRVNYDSFKQLVSERSKLLEAHQSDGYQNDFTTARMNRLLDEEIEALETSIENVQGELAAAKILDLQPKPDSTDYLKSLEIRLAERIAKRRQKPSQEQSRIFFHEELRRLNQQISQRSQQSYMNYERFLSTKKFAVHSKYDMVSDLTDGASVRDNPSSYHYSDPKVRWKKFVSESLQSFVYAFKMPFGGNDETRPRSLLAEFLVMSHQILVFLITSVLIARLITPIDSEKTVLLNSQ